MIQFRMKKGATGVILPISVFDSSSTTGGKLAGLAYNTSGLTAHYSRSGVTGAAVAVAFASATKGIWTSGGFVAVDDTNMPGDYELHVPNAVIATGADSVLIQLKGAADMVPVNVLIELTAFDMQSATVTVGTNSDKSGYALTASEHTAIAADTQTGMTAQGYTSTRGPKLDNLDAPIAAVNYNASNALAMLQSGIYGLAAIAAQASGANSGVGNLATHNQAQAWYNDLVSTINSRLATSDPRLDTITAIMDKVSNLSISSRVIATLPAQIVRPASGGVYLRIDTILYNSNGNLMDPPDLTDPGVGPSIYSGFGVLATRQDGSYVPLYKDALGTPLDTTALCHHASGPTPQIMSRSSLGNYGFYIRVEDTTELGSLTFKFAWFDIAPWQIGYDITSHRKELRQTVIVDFTGINTVINLLQDPTFGLQRLDSEIDTLLGAIEDIPTTPLLRTDERLDHLDADISPIMNTLSDNDHGLSALRNAVNSRLDASAYVAPENTVIENIKELLVEGVRVLTIDDSVDFTSTQRASLESSVQHDVVLAAEQPNYAPLRVGDEIAIDSTERNAIASTVWASVEPESEQSFGSLVGKLFIPSAPSLPIIPIPVPVDTTLPVQKVYFPDTVVGRAVKATAVSKQILEKWLIDLEVNSTATIQDYPGAFLTLIKGVKYTVSVEGWGGFTIVVSDEDVKMFADYVRSPA